jgi:hypothetical protein
MHARQLTNLIIAATPLCASAAIAGPPMVTDDTGTAAPGVLEIIVYAAGESRDAGESVQGPALDLAYGLSDTVEVSLTIPRQRAKDAGEASVTGWGEAIAGVKWRFHEGANTAIAVAPSLSIPLSRSSTIFGLVEDTTVFSAPLLASIALGRWEFTGNVGYSISSSSLDAISVATSAGYSLTPDFRLLAEVWGVDFVDDGASEGFLNWRLGMEWGLTKRVTLLAAYGGGVWTQLDEVDELNEDYFIGFQYALGN